MNKKRSIVESIIKLSDILKEIWETNFLNESSITSLQFNILWVILEEWATTMQDIRKKLIVSSASLSQTINRMEKKNLIIRVYWKWDKRLVNIDVTKEWNILYYKLRNIYENLINEKLSFLKQDEEELLLSLLFKIENKLTFKN